MHLVDEVVIHTVSQSFHGYLFSGVMNTPPEMLSMLISQGHDRRGWMFCCTFIGWVGWCLSERWALQLMSTLSFLNTEATAVFSFQRPDRKNAPTSLRLNHHSTLIDSPPCNWHNSWCKQMSKLTNKSTATTPMFKENIIYHHSPPSLSRDKNSRDFF